MSQTPDQNANERIAGSLPVPQAPTGSTRSAQSIAVHQGNLLLTGWAVKDDVVVVMAGGLDSSVEVSIAERRIAVEEIYETSRGIDRWEPLSALQLPEGSLKVGAEAFPPGLTPPPARGMPATYAFWCRLFPRIRGC